MKSKVWLIARHEYVRNVFKKSFILALLSLPLFIGLSVGMGVLLESGENNDSAIGYVDQAGVFSPLLPPPNSSSEEAIQFLAYQNEEAALQALDSNNIQAYFVLASDYAESNKAELVYRKEPGRNATSQFYDFLQTNLLSDLPLERAQLIARGTDLIIRSTEGGREFPEGGPPLGDTLPLLLAIAVVILLLMSSGYLMEGVVQERENHTMEVLMTSVSSKQMVVGKVLGIVGISFTQLLVWSLFGFLAIFLGGEVFDVQWLQNPVVDWRGLLIVLALGVPSYVLASVLMFTAGSIVSKAQDSQAFGPIVLMIFMIPLYVLPAIGNEPNGPIALTLSFIPFTSLTTFALRNLLTVVPVWQVVVAFAIQIISAVVALWIASGAFRLGMLRYGQRIRISKIFKKADKLRDIASTSEVQ